MADPRTTSELQAAASAARQQWKDSGDPVWARAEAALAWAAGSSNIAVELQHVLAPAAAGGARHVDDLRAARAGAEDLADSMEWRYIHGALSWALGGTADIEELDSLCGSTNR